MTEPEDLYREFEDSDDFDEDHEADGAANMMAPKPIDVANGNVTMAIFKAEDATYAAIAAWQHVERCERAILECSDISKLERNIAERGVALAKEKIGTLRTLVKKCGDDILAEGDKS